MDVASWADAGGLFLETAVEDAALMEPGGAPPVIVVPAGWDTARQDAAVATLVRGFLRRHGPAVAVALAALTASAAGLAAGHGAALVHLADLKDTVVTVATL